VLYFLRANGIETVKGDGTMEQPTADRINALWGRDFILILSINLFSFMGFYGLLPTLPFFAKNLGGSDTSAGLVIGVFTLSAVVIRPFAGQALDKYGRKGVLLVGMLIFALCMLAYIWTPSLLVLMVIRCIQGLGWGLMTTATSTAAADIIPKSRIGEGMGFFGLSGTLAMALAPAFGLYLIDNFNFTVLFIGGLTVAVLANFMALAVRYREIKNTANKFILVEKAALPASLVMLFLATTYSAVSTFLALYALEKGIANIGVFFMVYALALAIFRPLSGRLCDRFGFNYVVVPGIILMGAAMLLLFLADSITWFLAAGFVYGVGYGSTQPSLQAQCILAAPLERRGSANATFFIGFDLGIGLSSIMWGAIAELTGYGNMYLWSAVPVFTALVIYLKTSRNSKMDVNISNENLI